MLKHRHKPRRSLTVVLTLAFTLLTASACFAEAAQQDVPEKSNAKGMMTLDQAIDAALAYSPTVSQTRDSLDQAKSTRWQATTGFLPVLDTSYTFQKTQNPTTVNTAMGSITTSSDNTYIWSTSLTQPLFTGFRLTSTYKLADLGVDIARLNLQLSILDLAVSVKDAYYAYLVAIKAKGVADQAVTQLTSHLKNARDFHEVGILPINDVLKVEVELSNAQQQAVTAANNVAITRAQLTTLLGLNVDSSLDVEDILSEHEKVNFQYKTVRNIARKERPELKSVKLQIRQADWNVTKAQSEYYPQLGVVGSYDFTGDNWDFGPSEYYDTTDWSVVAQASLNIFSWGRTASEVNKARADMRIAEKALTNLRDQVDLQVKQAYLFMLEADKNIVTAETQVNQAKENYRITNERYKEQLTTNTELLDAQTLLTQAQNNYYSALGTYNIAKARLLRAMGRGVDQDKLAKLTKEEDSLLP